MVNPANNQSTAEKKVRHVDTAARAHLSQKLIDELIAAVMKMQSKHANESQGIISAQNSAGECSGLTKTQMIGMTAKLAVADATLADENPSSYKKPQDTPREQISQDSKQQDSERRKLGTGGRK